ncbi:MAG: glycoside hydrolase family 15 protein [Patescibacteria group bacterium]
MGRPILLSNGELHVGLNEFGLVHDFYFPYVGFENHSAGANLRHKIGVWVDGKTWWLDDGDWKIRMRTATGALIGHTSAFNEHCGVLLEFDDVVDHGISAFIRNVHIVNANDRPREIRLFMHQAFAIGDSRSNTDTAQYLPDSDALLHYRGRRAFVIGGRKMNGDTFDQHSIGLFGIEGHQGTYVDAEDGELGCSNVEHGRVDSVVRFSQTIAANESARVHYWIAAGTSTREALYVHKHVQDAAATRFIESTALWWHEWLAPVHAAAEKMTEKQREMFVHSALVVKANIDKRGAVIATTDTSMLNYARDAYGYCWPRDGAYALWPLIRLGYVSEPLRFFEFCRRGLHQSGYLMHKYIADGSLGSSWHPYVHGSVSAPPIQEDETALTLFMFSQFYQVQKDAKLLSEFYESFIKRMADFIAEYIDETTGLPRPSYDLWEENFITSTYTTSVVYAALLAAAELAEAVDDSDSAVKWRSSADDIQRAAHKYLFNAKRKSFYKGLRIEEGVVTPDETIDVSSFFGAFMFGLFAAGSDEVTQTFESLVPAFGFTDETPGLPRYENDSYQRTDPSINGNFWYITSLWIAQYSAEAGRTDSADKIIDWVINQADPAGMFAEQIDPTTGKPVSVSPLVWSHAEYMATMLDRIDGGNHGER